MTATAAQPEPAIDLRDRASFRIWTTHTVRYNDQDPLGHVNNAVYSTFLEAGRTALIKQGSRNVTAPAFVYFVCFVVYHIFRCNHRPRRIFVKHSTFIEGRASIVFYA